MAVLSYLSLETKFTPSRELLTAPAVGALPLGECGLPSCPLLPPWGGRAKAGSPDSVCTPSPGPGAAQLLPRV